MHPTKRSVICTKQPLYRRMVQYIHVQTETSLRTTLLAAHLFENATHLVLNRFVCACFKEELYNVSFTVI